MNNDQTNFNPYPPLEFLYFYFKTVFTNFLIHYPNFSIITNHCIYNDQHNDLCHEAWSLDLVSTKSFGSGKNPLFEI